MPIANNSHGFPILLVAHVPWLEVHGEAAELGPDGRVRKDIAGELELKRAGVSDERCELGRAGLRVGASRGFSLGGLFLARREAAGVRADPEQLAGHRAAAACHAAHEARQCAGAGVVVAQFWRDIVAGRPDAAQRAVGVLAERPAERAAA